MRTFTETLKFNSNLKMLEDCFALMSEKGIDPNRFVEWYCHFGIEKQDQSILIESCNLWIENEIGSNPQQTMQLAQVATKALDNLSARLGRSKNLRDRIADSQFGSMVISLKNMLSNINSNIQPTTTAVASAETPPIQTYEYSKFIDKINLKNQIRRDLAALLEAGVDPLEFVNWYLEEGRFLSESWFDNMKDSFGNMWSNVKNAWNNWGQAGQQRQMKIDAERDSQSVNAALQALQGLEQNLVTANTLPIQNFANMLSAVKEKLKKYTSPYMDVSRLGTQPAVPAASAQTPVPQTAPSYAVY